MPLQTSLIRPSPVPLLRAADARHAGMRPDSNRQLHRVRRGVYATASQWSKLTPWDRYLARVHAFALVSPGTIFSLESAAALWGLPVFGEPRDIHVFDDRRTRSVRFGDVCVHTSEDPRTIKDGVVSATSVADTAIDLARVLTPARALAVVDAAVSKRRLDRVFLADLIALSSAQASRRGRARLGWVWNFADGASESVGESVSRVVIAWLGFEQPELQRVFHLEGEEDRVDFYFARRRVIGESDGYGKYDASDPATMKAHFVREKIREDRLRRHVAGFARWDLADARRVQPLRAKLLAAGLPIVNAPQPAMLATLRSNPRSL